MTLGPMNRSVAFLACETTLPGMPNRRSDAYEFDRQFGALREAFAARDVVLLAKDWAEPAKAFAAFDAVVIGTPWNYQDHQARFLAQLEAIEAQGTMLLNPAELVAWNVRKTYLRELEEAGVATIPTLWLEVPMARHVESLLADHDGVVIKRQVGAGAAGQRVYRRGEALPDGPLLDRAAMLQPFMPSIQTEGELSLLFIDGTFSHAILKTAREGDYRIQSMFGGREQKVMPSQADIERARSIIDRVPFSTPLYARIDMVRDASGDLRLMEAEMIEPYLYPEQGPSMASMYAEAVLRRL